MEKSAIDLYFLDRSGGNFKATVFYEPYFYVDISDYKRMAELMNHLQRRFEGCRIEQVNKEDLDLPNHLSGKLHPLLKLSFRTVSDLTDARNELRSIQLHTQIYNEVIVLISRPIVLEHKKKQNIDDYDVSIDSSTLATVGRSDPLLLVTDLRESDVPYDMRVAIDLDLRVGAWFTVTPIPVRPDELRTLHQKLLVIYWLSFIGGTRLSVTLAKRHA